MTMNAEDAAPDLAFKKLLDCPASYCSLENGIEKNCGQLGDTNERLKLLGGRILR